MSLECQYSSSGHDKPDKPDKRCKQNKLITTYPKFPPPNSQFRNYSPAPATMPREKQKRGRRAEAKVEKDASKRKRDETPEDPDAKRIKPTTDDEPQPSQQADYIPLDEGQNEAPSGDMPFYGLLDAEEQEYFSRANEVL
jgi:hypothetical protein